MATVNKERLAEHVKLCQRNLKSWRVKCCATCPFEEFIIEEYSWMRPLFEQKRKDLEEGNLRYYPHAKE